MAATGEQKDPFRGFRFSVEIDQIQTMGFREASGLESSTDPIDYREGTDPSPSSHKVPGMEKHANLTLKRGFTNDNRIWEWRKQVIDGDIDKARRNIAVLLLDDHGKTLLRWNLEKAWPTKWTGPTFSATANEIAINALEVVYESITLVK